MMFEIPKPLHPVKPGTSAPRGQPEQPMRFPAGPFFIEQSARTAIISFSGPARKVERFRIAYSRLDAQNLNRLMRAAAPGITLDEFIKSRRKDKEITKEIEQRLAAALVTAIEGEDIEILSSALYQVPKSIGKFAERFLVSVERVRNVDFLPQLSLLERAIDLVRQMLKQSRRPNLSRLAGLNAQLQKVEAEADHLVMEWNCQLYIRKYDFLTSVLLKDLYDLLEKTMDRCRSAGNIMYRVALKHRG
jgi:uncharacterized protein Yka (UPF0111/DUF47 family)